MSELQKLAIAYGDCREQIGWLTRYAEATNGGPLARAEALRRLGIRVREAEELRRRLEAAELRAGL
jgi:hypothetical protein